MKYLSDTQVALATCVKCFDCRIRINGLQQLLPPRLAGFPDFDNLLVGAYCVRTRNDVSAFPTFDLAETYQTNGNAISQRSAR